MYSDSGELIMGYNGKKLRIENGSIYETVADVYRTTSNLYDNKGNRINPEGEYLIEDEDVNEPGLFTTYKVEKEGNLISVLFKGLCNLKGEKVVEEHVYQMIASFHDGMAIVLKDDKVGYINAQGEEHIPCIYHNAMPFFKDVACVLMKTEKSGDAMFIDKNNNVIKRIKDLYDFEPDGNDEPGYRINGVKYNYCGDVAEDQSADD